MRRQTGKPYSAEVYTQACEWSVEFRSAAPEESLRAAFHAWLQQAPAHMAAYLDVASGWKLTESFDVRARFPKEILIAQARDTDNLIAYPGATSPQMPRLRRGILAWLPSPAAGTLIVTALIVTALAILMLSRHSSPTYSTGIGQKRVVTLADGSVVQLNARSEIVVRFTKTRRLIDLVRGQALFRDTYAPDRPFIVQSRTALVRAIGTQFDVNQLDAETIVTVIRGTVAVAQQRQAMPAVSDPQRPRSRRPGARPATIYLTAGEQLTVGARRHMRPVRTDVTDVIAWTHQKLIFVGAPLDEVIQEFNRYNDRQLAITTPSLDRFRIDGVFSSTDPRSLLAFLRQYPGIMVRQTRHRVLISRTPP